MKASHAIRAVALETGLSPHVIRIWEKRYSAVCPTRTGTNRRLYSAEDVERLLLLREATQVGHSIGAIAGLPTEALRKLIPPIAVKEKGRLEPLASGHSDEFLDGCIDAVQHLNARKLERILGEAALFLGTQGVLQRLIAPLAQKIGDLWRDGTLTAAHEHFASAIIRIFLSHSAKSFVGVAGAPVIVIATPHGQLHELGALLVAAAAANLGWSVTYLGASLPATEIAGAALLNRARAVALSIVYPDDDPRMETELVQLRHMLAEVPILVGGRATPAYAATLKKTGIMPQKDLNDLCATLEKIRASGTIS